MSHGAIMGHQTPISGGNHRHTSQAFTHYSRRTHYKKVPFRIIPR